MKNIRIFLSALLAAAMLMGLTACGRKPAAPDTTPDNNVEPALKDITFVLDWTPNTNHTGVYVAIANGYFEEAGLNVSVVQPPDDGTEVLIASGRAQFGVGFQDTLAGALVGDAALPISAVAAVLQHNTSGIVSRAGEGMDRPAGLEGKRYATWDLEAEKATLRQVVENDGGDFSKVQLIPSTVTDEVSALQTHSVDAIWIFYGWAGVACELAGLDIDYFDFTDFDPVFDYYTPVILANNDFLANDPDTAKAFLSALSKGYTWAAENPREAADILMEAAPELASNPDLIYASQEYLSAEYISDASQFGVIDPARWNAFYAWMNENNLVSGTLEENAGLRTGFLPQA